MAVQIIEHEGSPEYAVLPYAEYESLLELAEDIQDIKLADMAQHEENIPSEIVDKLLDGESKLKVWRKFRNFTQSELADKAHITQSMITMIEKGNRIGTTDTLGKIAKVLDIDIDDLT